MRQNLARDVISSDFLSSNSAMLRQVHGALQLGHTHFDILDLDSLRGDSTRFRQRDLGRGCVLRASMTSVK
jgi:hypothetical protein